MPRRLERFILITGLLLALIFIGGQAVYRIEYYRFATKLAKSPPELDNIPGTQPREILVPFTSTDSFWWILHTEDMLKRGDWRVRETNRDNAPLGREVHWSSGLMWLLALLAWLIHLFSGIPTINAVQHAALIVGPLMLAGFTIVFAAMAARRWGGAAGGLIAMALATLAPLDALFCPGEADHHGIVSCLALGCVLSTIAAGGGRIISAEEDRDPYGLIPSRARARRWIIVAGLLGAAGLWVSAATMVPVFAGIAIGAIASAWSSRSPKEPATEAMPEIWRIWGISGAIGSLAFYLLEYAPTHFGWRLEVNHPLYAAAFWGCGELLARICGFARGDRFATPGRDTLMAALAFSALAALPITIIVGGTSVFTIQDSFLWNLHQKYILEFQSITRLFADAPWTRYIAVLPAWPLLGLPIAWRFFNKHSNRCINAPLAIALFSPLPITALSILQVRWIGVAQTIWLAASIACLALWRTPSRRRSKIEASADVFIFLAGISVFPALSIPQWSKPKIIQREEATELVVRDIAWKLRLFEGSKPINVISGPTTTTKLAFFGDTKGVGTLYWENLAGLKTVAAIYGAKNDSEALRICREHEVTHIVLFSWDSFAEPYARLHQGREMNVNTDDCFISSLLNKHSVPLWLRPLPYQLVPELIRAGQWVLICEVRPDQTAAEASYYLGKYHSDTGHPDLAINFLLKSWNLDSNSTTGLALGYALIESNRTDDAQKLATLLPPSERSSLEARLGRHFLNSGRHREAATALRAALSTKTNDREFETDLAWLLATSEDPSVRDGNESLLIMKRLKEAGEPLSIHEAYVFAAAYAEIGDFSQALTLIDQAIDTGKSAQNPDLINKMMAQRDAYSKNMAFRISSVPAQ